MMFHLVQFLPQWSQLNSKSFSWRICICTFKSYHLAKFFATLITIEFFFMNSCNMFLQSNILCEIFTPPLHLYFLTSLLTFFISILEFYFSIISFLEILELNWSINFGTDFISWTSFICTFKLKIFYHTNYNLILPFFMKIFYMYFQIISFGNFLIFFHEQLCQAVNRPSYTDSTSLLII